MRYVPGKIAAAAVIATYLITGEPTSNTNLTWQPYDKGPSNIEFCVQSILLDEPRYSGSMIEVGYDLNQEQFDLLVLREIIDCLGPVPKNLTLKF